MIIKQIYLNKKDYINKILKELCKNNISYVYIEESNELHYDNYIIRFITNNYIKSLSETSIDDLLYEIYRINENRNMYSYDSTLLIFEKEKIKQFKTKDYKILNHMLNEQIKKSKINCNHILKKQLNPTRKVYKK